MATIHFTWQDIDQRIIQSTIETERRITPKKAAEKAAKYPKIYQGKFIKIDQIIE